MDGRTAIVGDDAVAEGQPANLEIIALDGDPLKDITAVRRVVFVMKGGKAFVNQPPVQNK